MPARATALLAAMGACRGTFRKTWRISSAPRWAVRSSWAARRESLPPVFRPLPGRRNIVVTRQGDWQASGAEVAHSLEQALALCQDAPLAWVMGGADIYRQALPLAQQVVVTEIGADFSGDAFAPELDNTWQPLHTSPQHTSSTGLPHRFVTYGRKPQSGDAT